MKHRFGVEIETDTLPRYLLVVKFDQSPIRLPDVTGYLLVYSTKGFNWCFCGSVSIDCNIIKSTNDVLFYRGLYQTWKRYIVEC